jgi:hypothetical protein
MNTINMKPSAIKATATNEKVGARAVTVSTDPKMIAVVSKNGLLGRRRRNVPANAPNVAPMASTVDRKPKASAPRPNTCLASRAMLIWKFRLNVPMTRTTTMGNMRSARPRT